MQESEKLLTLHSYLFCCFWVVFRNMVACFLRFSWLCSPPQVWSRPHPLSIVSVLLDSIFVLSPSCGVLSLKHLSNPYCGYLALTIGEGKHKPKFQLANLILLFSSIRWYPNSSFNWHRNHYQADWWFAPIHLYLVGSWENICHLVE